LQAFLPDLSRGKDHPEDAIATQEISQAIFEFRTQLRDERDRAIWDQRLHSATPASLSDLGNQFGLSKECIRQSDKMLREELKSFLLKRFGGDESLIRSTLMAWVREAEVFSED